MEGTRSTLTIEGRDVGFAVYLPGRGIAWSVTSADESDRRDVAYAMRIATLVVAYAGADAVMRDGTEFCGVVWSDTKTVDVAE